jgi:plastocyanin
VSTTGLFRVDFGATACLKFTAAGSFPFKCEPHQFVGTVVVQ